jgi:hypothetical protein
MTETLFISFPPTLTQAQLENMMEVLGNSLPDEVNAIAVPDSIDFMDESEVEEFAQNIVEALDD